MVEEQPPEHAGSNEALALQAVMAAISTELTAQLDEALSRLSKAAHGGDLDHSSLVQMPGGRSGQRRLDQDHGKKDEDDGEREGRPGKVRKMRPSARSRSLDVRRRTSSARL